MKLRSTESTSSKSCRQNNSHSPASSGCWIAIHSSRIASVDLEELELEALQEFFENAYHQIMADDCSSLMDEEA